MNLVNSVALGSLLGLVATGAAIAAPVSTDADMFGQITSLDGQDTVTFSGSGIPTDAVNFSTFMDDHGNTLRLGLTATPRYGAPKPENDGAGTFIPTAGTSDDGRALWNFSFYAEIDGPTSIQDIGLELLYDLDPGVNTHIDDLGVINAALFNSGSDTVAQNSQNLTFNYLHTGVPGFNTSPAVTDFDADLGQYSFFLRAKDFGSVGINVNVGDVEIPPAVPLPAALPLLLAGLGGLTLVRRRDRA